MSNDISANTMATWREQYLAALQARDAVEQANLDLYDYCTKLADEKAELERQRRPAEKGQVPDDAPEPAASLGWGIRRVTSPTTGADSPNSTATQLAQLRQDFAKAQAERADLQT